MAIVWICEKCTYRHEGKESVYLTCAICTAPKPTTATTKTKTTVTNNRTATCTNPKKKQKKLEQVWTKPKEKSLPPFNQFNIRQRSDAACPTATNTTKIATSIGSNNVSTAIAPSGGGKRLTPQKQQRKSGTKRSILDVLKPCRSSSFIPPARYRDNPKQPWRKIDSIAEIPKLCPMTIIHDVLPSNIASTLLEQLETESSTSWNRGHWIIAGTSHSIPRTTATYNLSTAPGVVGDNDDFSEKKEKNPNCDTDDKKCHSSGVRIEEDEDEEYLDPNTPKQGRTIAPELCFAANRVSELVQRHCPWAVTTENHSWEPTFALANRYANGQECVGWHADHVTPLGPRPIIVGLTLGACRRFDFRQQQQNKKLSSVGIDDKSTILCRHVSVSLPHNSVCIMWNDAQESWQHSIPRCSDGSFGWHPTVGPVRISLTFRKQRQDIPNLGNCYCGRPVGLKAKDGRYYLFCKPYGKDKIGGKTCIFWKPCVWAEQEAKRLSQLEKKITPTRAATKRRERAWA